MKKIVDIVNLNADASCLSSERWLAMLRGGKSSELYGWFHNFVRIKKKVTLGISGSTLSDISSFNAECIELLKANPEIFEFIVRPYAHDIALLRSAQGFSFNLHAGVKVLEQEGLSYVNFYLPPEFMLTNLQVKLLEESGIAGTFIHYARFKPELQDRIPKQPYILSGIAGSSLKCIPMESLLTQAFLHGIHHYNADSWNKLIENHDLQLLFSWRDGESAFLIPDGNRREASWLESESQDIQRAFLSEIFNELDFQQECELAENTYCYYPTHSFMAWMKESRMLGFLNRTGRIEEQLPAMTPLQRALWLQVINSDILSAIEKNSPTIQLLDAPGAESSHSYTIWRSSRGVEGEELLYYLEADKSPEGDNAFAQKVQKRLEYISRLKL